MSFSRKPTLNEGGINKATHQVHFESLLKPYTALAHKFTDDPMYVSTKQHRFLKEIEDTAHALQILLSAIIESFNCCLQTVKTIIASHFCGATQAGF